MMQRSGVVARWTAVVGTAAMLAVPLAAVTHAQSPQTVAADVRLAASTVPPGGLITSFLANQALYCSIICPLLGETAVTAATTAVRAPSTFLTALQAGDLLRAIGIAAASVTGPTNAAAQAAILADGTKVAPRALNALEVGVVGRLDILSAAADGLPGIVAAIRAARADTFTALHLPVVPNPTPTATPHGVLQVTAVEALNVVGAIIFPAFNDLLSAAFEVPDAIAQELAVTGNPVRALAAGAGAAAGRLNAAVTVVAQSVVTAAHNIGMAIQETRATNQVTPSLVSANSARNDDTRADSPRTPRAQTAKHRDTRDVAEKTPQLAKARNGAPADSLHRKTLLRRTS